MTKKRLFWILRAFITLLILVVLVKIIKVNEIKDAMLNADKTGVFIAAALLPLNLGIQIIKWGTLLRALKPSAGVLDVAGSLLVGFTLGIVTPGRIGEFGRAFAVRKAEPIQVAALSLIDKLFTLLCIGLFGGAAILLLPGMVLQQELTLVITAAVVYAVGSTIAVYIALHPGFVRGILYSISLMLPKRDKMKAIIGCFDGLTKQKARTVLILSVLFYFTFIMQFYILANSFGNLSFIDGIRGLPSIIFTKTFLPISIGGLGVGELASIRFLSIFKVEAAAAFNASLILFTINVLIPGMVGLLFLPRLKFRSETK